MGDVDVVYRCHLREWWKCISRHTQPESVNMAIYCTVGESYLNKKVFWNAIGKLRPDGIFCIQCYPENISDIIKLVIDQDMHYAVAYYQITEIPQEPILSFIFTCRHRVCLPKTSSFTKLNTLDDLAYSFFKLGQFGDLILSVGDTYLGFCPIAKNLGRYVIAIGGADTSVEDLKNNGIREVDLRYD